MPKAGGKQFDMPLDHQYIHFTTRWRALKIVQNMRLMHGEACGMGVFAVPVGGRYYPYVQRYDSTYQEGYSDKRHGRKVEAARSTKNYAVLFTTTSKPAQVYRDEAKWSTTKLADYIPLTEAKIITLKQAEKLLNNSLPGNNRWAFSNV